MNQLNIFHHKQDLKLLQQLYAKLFCPNLDESISPLYLFFHLDVKQALSLICEYDLCSITRLSIFQGMIIYILLYHCIFFQENKFFKILY